LEEERKPLAPVVIFCYKRIDLLRRTVSALSENILAPDTHLYFFSDAPKLNADEEKVRQVRDYLNTVTGFAKITIVHSPTNKGLARSIIEGVTTVILNHDRIIVLEDDLITSRNFLSFMNDALSFYEMNDAIFSITGFTIPINIHKDNTDIYFTQRSSSWGWGTWKNRWINVKWDIPEYDNFKVCSKKRKAFNRMGSDLSYMLKKQQTGKIDSWAIRWCFYQFLNNKYSVHPMTSKVLNIGLEHLDASNTNERINRFTTILDNTNKVNFIFESNVRLDKNIIKKFIHPYSVYQRLSYKLLNFLLGLSHLKKTKSRIL
jgi:hypothetical protein